jgi:hypothetical protein
MVNNYNIELRALIRLGIVLRAAAMLFYFYKNMVTTKRLRVRCSTHESCVAREITILTHIRNVFSLNTVRKWRIHARKLFCGYPQQNSET